MKTICPTVRFAHKVITALMLSLSNVIGCSSSDNIIPSSPLDGNWLFISSNQNAFAELSIHSNEYYLILMVLNSPNTAQAIGEIGNLTKRDDNTLVFVATKSSCKGLVSELVEYYLEDSNTLNVDIGYSYTLDGMKKYLTYPSFNFQINFGCFNGDGDFISSDFSI